GLALAFAIILPAAVGCDRDYSRDGEGDDILAVTAPGGQCAVATKLFIHFAKNIGHDRPRVSKGRLTYSLGPALAKEATPPSSPTITAAQERKKCGWTPAWIGATLTRERQRSLPNVDVAGDTPRRTPLSNPPSVFLPRRTEPPAFAL